MSDPGKQRFVAIADLLLLGSRHDRPQLEANRRSLRSAASLGRSSQRFKLSHRRNDRRVEHFAYLCWRWRSTAASKNWRGLAGCGFRGNRQLLSDRKNLSGGKLDRG